MGGCECNLGYYFMLCQNGQLADFTTKWGSLPCVTVKELLSWGEVGLGAALDSDGNIAGEAIIMDGVAYSADKTGNIKIMQPEDKIGFAQVSYLEPEYKLEVVKADNMEDLTNKIKGLLPDKEKDAFVLRLRGSFEGLSVRTVGMKGKQYNNFNKLLEDASIFSMLADVKCDVSGIFNQPGFVCASESPCGIHLHVVDHERKVGGHVLEFDKFQGEVEVMPVKAWLVTMGDAINKKQSFRLAKLNDGQENPFWIQHIQQKSMVNKQKSYVI